MLADVNGGDARRTGSAGKVEIGHRSQDGIRI
jgi:hypothetical protein